MKKQIMLILGLLTLILFTPVSEFLTNQLSLILEVKPHHAAHKLNMGLLVFFFASLSLWTVILTVRNLKNF
jgi:hypothetical protein